ncbi:MAG TPA: 16S rRNA (uracil(1498)-N(3))-methyltransferase [Woeseiaceae bacterium]|nr:16S rRNA (uracil(1498)-N(3))-methyltransferase [Woeseiaceae bacterium]
MKTTIRLYVPGPLIAGADLLLPPDRSHYASRVLRLRAGDDLVLFDGSDREFPARVAQCSREGVTAQVGEARERSVESPLAIHLVQGISRGERMDLVVQKTTELGVHRITPVATEFSVVRLGGEKAENRLRHWQKIAQSACEQCGRNRVPIVDAPLALADRLQDAPSTEVLRVLLHPGAQRNLAPLDRPVARVELLIGPEGGLSEGEIDRAVTAGFTPCSLGPRILRTETAAIAAVAVLQSHAGDL